ncbi:capsular polysaccharide synthesis protein [Salinarimonas sp.]|uniref:capsular polysaccharide synthesis protein n=1 Tax=Salinarimonas sp. TaxID=2766526 RepID=UPI0032D9AD48
MLNKTVWLLWLQGWDTAPWLVRQVAESWKINNPGWNIEFLSEGNLGRYVNDIDYIHSDDKDISPQAKSDIIRLSLLKNHGGVWADATLLCMQPLEPWVEEAAKPAGLWMYHGSGGGMRPTQGPASWFIVSHKNGLMIEKWKTACDSYWRSNDSVKNYFWLDALFRKLFESDKDFRECWKRAPYLYCSWQGQAHMLAYPGGTTSSDDGVKSILEQKPPYILKLWWKRWADIFPDVAADEAKRSNGYFAVQMSKRSFTHRHRMLSKGSLAFAAAMARLYADRKILRYRRSAAGA